MIQVQSLRLKIDALLSLMNNAESISELEPSIFGTI